MDRPLYFRYKELKAKGKITKLEKKLWGTPEAYVNVYVKRYDPQTGELLGDDIFRVTRDDGLAAKQRLQDGVTSINELIADVQAL